MYVYTIGSGGGKTDYTTNARHVFDTVPMNPNHVRVEQVGPKPMPGRVFCEEVQVQINGC